MAVINDGDISVDMANVSSKSPRDEFDTIFDSITCHFNIGVFFKQFLIHLSPIPLPFALLLGSARNQDFLSFDIALIILNHISGLIFLVMWISSFVLANKGYDTNGAFYIPLFYYVLHRFQIAVKYASLSHTEYKKFMTTTYDKAKQYRDQLMLQRGWFDRNPISLEFEMAGAAMRCGIDVVNLNFTISNPARHEDALSQYRNWKGLLLGKSDISI